MDAFIQKLRDEALEKADAQEKVRNSPEYQEQLEFLRRTIDDLSKTFFACNVAASIWAKYSDDYLWPRYLDDIVEAATIVQSAVEYGSLNSARRELRFILEVAVNIAYVDVAKAGDSIDERIKFYRGRGVNKQNVDHVRQLPLHLLGVGKEKFVQHVKEMWVMASNYVHLTKQQVDRKLVLRAQGIEAGFETIDMLKEVVDEIHQVCSIVVVLAFETIGSSFTGDILVDGLDVSEDWSFHASGYVALIDAYFDYKHERQGKLEQHGKKRRLRVRYHQDMLND